MNRSRFFQRVSLALCLALSTAACELAYTPFGGGTDQADGGSENHFDAGNASDGGSNDGGTIDAGPLDDKLHFAAAQSGTELTTAEVSDGIFGIASAGKYFLRFNGVNVWAYTDPTFTDVTDFKGPFKARNSIMSVAVDERHQLVYFREDRNHVDILDLAAEGGPAMLPVGYDASFTPFRIAVSGDNLYLSREAELERVKLNYLARAPSPTLDVKPEIPGSAEVWAVGGGLFYLADGDQLSAYDASFTRVATISLPVPYVTGLIAFGSKVVALGGDHLLTYDFAPAQATSGETAPLLLFDTHETIATNTNAYARQGRLLALTRGDDQVVILDLTDLAAPRALTVFTGLRNVTSLAWPRDGQLAVRMGNVVKTLLVPTIITSRFPATGSAIPVEGPLPIGLSMSPVSSDPDVAPTALEASGLSGTTQFRWNRETSTIYALPGSPLPGGAEVTINAGEITHPLGGHLKDLGVLKDGTDLTSLRMRTTTERAASISTGHVAGATFKADGAFTDWMPSTGRHEWSGITPRHGMYSHLYADYDGSFLTIMSDWVDGLERLDDGCYGAMQLVTSGGNQRWDIRIYSNRTEIRNVVGVMGGPETVMVTAATTYGVSPNSSVPHHMYEVRVPAGEGTWRVSVQAPGSRFTCDRLEVEPVAVTGEIKNNGTAPTVRIDQPAPSLTSPPQVTNIDPPDNAIVRVTNPVRISWVSDPASTVLATNRLQIREVVAAGASGRLVVDEPVYGNAYVVPTGVFEAGKSYRWTVVSSSLAETVNAAEATFFATTVQGPNAPELVSPADGATVATSVTLTWNRSTVGDDPLEYLVDISTDSAFSLGGIVYSGSAGSNPSATFDQSQLTPGTSYYWRVRARNDGGISTSVTWSFTLSP